MMAAHIHRWPTFLCPLTSNPMLDPVKAEDGHTYERKAIEKWLEENTVSPQTRKPMGKKLTPDKKRKTAIENYDKAHKSEKRYSGGISDCRRWSCNGDFLAHWRSQEPKHGRNSLSQDPTCGIRGAQAKESTRRSGDPAGWSWLFVHVWGLEQVVSRVGSSACTASRSSRRLGTPQDCGHWQPERRQVHNSGATCQHAHLPKKRHILHSLTDSSTPTTWPWDQQSRVVSLQDSARSKWSERRNGACSETSKFIAASPIWGRFV